jgi:uncharacterized RDD family membrane protein YckC
VQYEDRITIPTPEGVSLELTLAGLGSRAMAGAVDLALKAVAVAVLLIVFVAAIGDPALLVFVPLAGMTMLVYDVLFETLGGGRTPGKRVAGLRVVRTSGRPVDLTASVIRNALRLGDGLPLSYVPTIVSIIVTRRNQRPGDLAADTVVIRDRREIDRAWSDEATPYVPEAEQRWPSPVAAAAAPPGTRPANGAAWDVSAVPSEDIATVRAFLERRAGLTDAARFRLAKQLDGALRPCVGGADEPDPERFLEILYDAKRARG